MMANSDDEYFEDGLDLDDAALASIQQTEDRFAASSSSHPPPLKKLRTTYGWIQPKQSVDDNPEIVLNPDGSYSALPSSTAHKPISSPRSATLQSEVAALRTQLSELKAAHASTLHSLQAAQEEHFSKTGEISNLRRTLEKTSRDHAEAMAKIKAQREAAEVAKQDLQAKLKEETDRIATRLMFKQQEQAESSARKASWPSTSRARRPLMKGSPGPQAAPHTPTRKGLRMQTPPPFSLAPGTSSSSSQQKTAHDPRGTRVTSHQPVFKGFQNAFKDSAPVLTRRLTPQRAAREEAALPEVDDAQASGVILSDGVPEGGVASALHHDDNDDDGIYKTHNDTAHDAFMDIDERPSDPLSSLLDPVEELRHILFSHMAPGHDSLTLQVILSTPLPAAVAPAFAEACQTILAQCGSGEWERERGGVGVDAVMGALVDVGGLLCDAGCITPLLALLDLLARLILYVPAFIAPLLRPTAVSRPDAPKHILSLLARIIHAHIPPTPAPAASVQSDTPRAALALALIHLMECLYWNFPQDGFEDRLDVDVVALQSLLRVEAPKVVESTLRLLVLIATHESSFHWPRPESSAKTNGDVFALVERVCLYLIDAPRTDSYTIYHLSIIFLLLLHDMHPHLFSLLLSSPSTATHVPLIPSIILCITALTKLFWEDVPEADTRSMLDEAKSRMINTIYLSATLLHHVILLPVDLAHQLTEATHSAGIFNGVAHMFVVTFARLAWTDVPSCLVEEERKVCECVAELAVEILEAVVVGPEFDMLWAVWHDEEDEVEDAVEVEEEIEARNFEAG